MRLEHVRSQTAPSDLQAPKLDGVAAGWVELLLREEVLDGAWVLRQGRETWPISTKARSETEDRRGRRGMSVFHRPKAQEVYLTHTR